MHVCNIIRGWKPPVQWLPCRMNVRCQYAQGIQIQTTLINYFLSTLKVTENWATKCELPMHVLSLLLWTVTHPVLFSYESRHIGMEVNDAWKNLLWAHGCQLPKVAVFKILESGSFEDQKSSKHSISQGAAEEVLLHWTIQLLFWATCRCVKHLVLGYCGRISSGQLKFVKHMLQGLHCLDILIEGPVPAENWRFCDS